MARRAISLTVVSTTLPSFSGGGHVDIGADQTTVAANVATLVADAGTPTQGHVTTLNTNWGLLNTDLNGDIVLSYNVSNVVSNNVLIAGLREIISRLQGSNDLT